MEKRRCLLRIFGSILIITLLIFGPSSVALAESPPQLDALAVTDIWDLSVRAKARLSVLDAPPISSKGFCWSLNEDPTVDDNFITDDTTGTNLLAAKITGLLPGRTYYLRSFAVTHLGTHYDVPISFTTLSNVIRVDDDWAGTSPGADPDGDDSPAESFGTDSFATIRSAVDFALAGVSIMIKDGIYTGEDNKNIIIDKELHIRSENGPQTVLIDCEGEGRGFEFQDDSGQVNQSVLSGITIKNGNANQGGAIYIHSASPQITNCILTYNKGGSSGGAIHTSEGSPTITDSVISFNVAKFGGGVSNYTQRNNSIIFIGNCLLSENTALQDGGAIYNGWGEMSGTTSKDMIDLSHCTLVHNTALSEGGAIWNGGGYSAEKGKVNISSCILWGNTAQNQKNQIFSGTRYSGPYISNYRAEVSVGYSLLEGGLQAIATEGDVKLTSGGHNLDTDPMFALQGDQHLLQGSPCIDSANPDISPPPGDIDGVPRLLDGDGDTISIADIGAYEYNPGITIPKIAVSSSLIKFITNDKALSVDDLQLSIRNTTSATDLNWLMEAGTCSDWIEISSMTGNSNGAVNTITLHVIIPDYMAPGHHTCALSVTDPVAINSPQIIEVNLTINRMIYVPDDYATIQAAIDAAIAGDTIVVRDGIYTGPGNHNLDFHGKAITLRSENGPQFTIIDCDNSNPAVKFQSMELEGSVFEGFTIQNFQGQFASGAVLCAAGVKPIISNCIFQDNSIAIYIDNQASPSIRYCEFRSNDSAIEIKHASSTVTNCSFKGNVRGILVLVSSLKINNSHFVDGSTALDFQTYDTDGLSLEVTNCVFDRNLFGISLSSYGEKYVLFRNNTFLNHSNFAIGGYVSGDNPASFKIENCILWENDKDLDLYPFNAIITHSVVQDFAGNDPSALAQQHILTINPQLVDLDNGDYRLEAASPCIDAGTLITDLHSDIRGSIRPLDGPDLGSDADFDMGAYEYSGYYGGQHDVTTDPFLDLQIKSPVVIAGFEYKVNWKDNDPFPQSDNRLVQADAYTVRLVLVNEDGRRIELDTFTEPLGPWGIDAEYSHPVTFSASHIGTWYLQLELVDDPNLFTVSSDPITIKTGKLQNVVLGQEIVPPAGVLTDKMPTCNDTTACYWSTSSNKLYSTRPTKTVVTWYGDENLFVEVPIGIISEIPADYQRHVAGSPPVNLLTDDSSYDAVQILYTGSGATTVGSDFRADKEGFTVLRYSNSSDSSELFELVRTVLWNHAPAQEIVNDFSYPEERYWDIGVEITDSRHNPECGGGYVVHENAYYDGFGSDKSYDRDTRQGQIIPVNRDLTGKWENDPERTEDDMIVVWYQKGITKVSWPYLAVRYESKWPDESPNPINSGDAAAVVDSIVVDESKGSGPLLPAEYGSSDNMSVYSQADRTQPGFNPNEEHALLEAAMDATGEAKALFALRNDLNRADTSAPYALLKYRKPNDNDKWSFKAYKIAVSEESSAPGYRPFELEVESAQILRPPYPFNTLYFTPCEENGEAISNTGPFHKDKNGELYALQPTGNSPVVLNWFYPLRDSFYYDQDDDGEQDAAPGECIPWKIVLDNATGSQLVDVSYDVHWPADSPQLTIGETLLKGKNGLPEINNQCSVRILYGNDSVKLIDPLGRRAVTLTELPEDIEFDDLPFHLSQRLSYSTDSKELRFEGLFDDTMAGEPLLLLNSISYKDQQQIKELSPLFDPDNPDNPDVDDDTADAFLNAVDKLAIKTRLDLTKALTSAPANGDTYQSADSKALTTGAASTTGNAIVIFNDWIECTGPVDMQTIEVTCPLYRGEIKVIEPKNVFDNRVTMRHSIDFGGKVDQWDATKNEVSGKPFNWLYCEETADENCDTAPHAYTTNPVGDTPWKVWPGGSPFSTTASNTLDGAVEVIVEGSGDKTLSDKWFIAQYEHSDVCGIPGQVDEGDWSAWTPPQLYQGWIKRVLAAINLYDQKFKEFHLSEVDTVADMIIETGKGYEGDVALNYDPDNLNSLGLIEFYQTVLNKGVKLTVDAVPPTSTPGSNQQLLLAASRLSDLYMLLGNEAYGDALDPTIGFGTSDGQFGSFAPSIFAFQNQLPDLLSEELSLLRGRSTEGIRPFYNRLPWNFSQTEGEVAYQQNYNIGDENQDGEINEFDARIRFPQGHGDAWGHYLSAVMVYYDLLKHEQYVWLPRAESILLAGTPIDVDYLDERRFAKAASAKAKAGVSILELTYRQNYVEDSNEHLLGFRDPLSADSSWSVDGWASRAGQGAYFDWIVGNAIIPSTDPDHEGIEKIDRTTVVELADIANQLVEIQVSMDRADMGFNPLGLASGAIPFDIDPNLIDEGSSHFEQIYSRALDALNNAVTVFDHANKNTQRIRSQQDSLSAFQGQVDDQEADYTNRLIEIFGYPYPDDCGPGKTYPTGYDQTGPDVYHYDYLDIPEVLGKACAQEMTSSAGVTINYLAFDKYVVNNPLPWVFQEPKSVDYNVVECGDYYGVAKNVEWKSKRRAPGELQQALSAILQSKGALAKALKEHRNIVDEIEDKSKLIYSKIGVGAEKILIQSAANGGKVALNVAILAAKGLELSLGTAGDTVEKITEALKEVPPKTVGAIAGVACGTVVDALGPARATIDISGQLAWLAFNVGKNIAELAGMGLEQAKETIDWGVEIAIEGLDANLEIKSDLLELENLLRSEAASRIELHTLLEALNHAAGDYLATKAKGARLLEERYNFRVNTAADVQNYRYTDMAFRIFRNDALQKYRAQLDMASKYTYLAAKAYDYETALLDSDSRAGKAFLSNIVQQRSIGTVDEGEPLTGTGLADSLKRMSLNFQVLKPQMGFNNPQVETNRFSLRKELFRIRGQQDSDTLWQEALRNNYVENLWSIPEFKRHCRPFAAEGIPQPGIVIPFSTTVTAGLNFFGWPLGAGDSYYSASNFATKARSVGVWFSDYSLAGMAQTPRVYLVPVGADLLRAPAYDPANLREWHVVDQRIPQPMPIAPSELDNNPGWIPLVDTISDELFQIRRHSDFRAYHDSGWINESEMTFDSRLIGRSVYNTRWLLIIPGQNLLYDAEEGIQRFIEGTETFYGSGERTGNGVSDIKLLFQTYSYSGN